MIYLPDEWIINKANKERIHSILTKLDRDIVLKDDMSYNNAIKELKEIGETMVIEKIEDGTIMFGA